VHVYHVWPQGRNHGPSTGSTVNVVVIFWAGVNNKAGCEGKHHGIPTIDTGTSLPLVTLLGGLDGESSTARKARTNPKQRDNAPSDTGGSPPHLQADCTGFYT
jgi:hypothetical protein